jgi:hypothetical protein
MINKLYLREALAWTAVLLALVLFSTTVAFAQAKTVNVTSENGKVHIVSKTNENGKTVVRDTTFELKDGDLDNIIEEFTGSGKDDGKEKKKDIHFKHSFKNDDTDKSGKQKHVTVDVDAPGMTEADKKKLHEDIERSMEDMRKGLKEMHKSLQSMNIQIDDDDMNFNFDFNTDGFKELENLNIDGLDSLNDDEHFVIVGDGNEKEPALEKVIEKDGKKIFVYKRVNPQPKGEVTSQWIEGFQVFPNPASGIVTVKFKSPNKFDLTLNITDEKGKSVYSEKLPAYSGNFSKEIDLTNKGKGTFMVTISDANNTLTKKIVVN